VIKHVEGGATKADAAIKFAVDHSLVSKWCGPDRVKILAHAKTTTLADTSFKIKAAGLPQPFEDALLTWIRIARSHHPPQPITFSIVQKKAQQFAKQIFLRLDELYPSPSSPPPPSVDALVTPIKTFKFSDGWVGNFFKRYSLGTVALHGEGGSAPMEQVDRGRIDLKMLLADYELSDIYNADEFALFYELLPATSVDFLETDGTRSNRRGVKKSKARVTGLVCCNADGSDKLKPLVIGKSKTPIAMRKINMDNLPCTYRHSKKGWMNVMLFLEFLNWFNGRIRTSRSGGRRQVILLIDGAGCHGKPGDYRHLSNTTVHWLPANCTSHLQPLDAGIIRALKARYRTKVIDRQLRWFELSQIDQQSNQIVRSGPYRPPNVKDAVDMLASSWKAVTALTISRCWRHTRILPVELSVLVEEDPKNADLASEDVAVLTDAMNKLGMVTREAFVEPAAEYVQADDEEPTEVELDEDDIVEEVFFQRGAEMKAEDDEDEEKAVEAGKEEKEEKIGPRERLLCFQRTIKAIEQWEGGVSEEWTNMLLCLRDEVERAEKVQRTQRRQTSIQDFFK
jgi:hypothetical protein